MNAVARANACGKAELPCPCARTVAGALDPVAGSALVGIVDDVHPPSPRGHG